MYAPQVPMGYVKPHYVMPAPPPVYITPAPVYVTTQPPPICWVNEDGFECCSKILGKLMVDFLSSEQAPKGCNMQKAANALQVLAQNHFNYSFEAIISQSEMATKIHFMGRLMCKIRTKDGKV
ncbi:ground-like domain protein, partial [Cooperia oncophora]